MHPALGQLGLAPRGTKSSFAERFHLRTCVYSRYAVLRFQLFQGFWSGPFMLDSRLELLDIH